MCYLLQAFMLKSCCKIINVVGGFHAAPPEGYMESFNRKSIRLKEYDYSQAGYYFMTVCTKDRPGLFGEFVGADDPVRPPVPIFLNILFSHCLQQCPGYIPIKILSFLQCVHFLPKLVCWTHQNAATADLL